MQVDIEAGQHQMDAAHPSREPAWGKSQGDLMWVGTPVPLLFFSLGPIVSVVVLVVFAIVLFGMFGRHLLPGRKGPWRDTFKKESRESIRVGQGSLEFLAVDESALRSMVDSSNLDKEVIEGSKVTKKGRGSAGILGTSIKVKTRHAAPPPEMLILDFIDDKLRQKKLQVFPLDPLPKFGGSSDDLENEILEMLNDFKPAGVPPASFEKLASDIKGLTENGFYLSQRKLTEHIAEGLESIYGASSAQGKDLVVIPRGQWQVVNPQNKRIEFHLEKVPFPQSSTNFESDKIVKAPVNIHVVATCQMGHLRDSGKAALKDGATVKASLLALVEGHEPQTNTLTLSAKALYRVC